MLYIIRHDFYELFSSVTDSRGPTEEVAKLGNTSRGTVTEQTNDNATDRLPIDGYIEKRFLCWSFISAVRIRNGVWILALFFVSICVRRIFFGFCLRKRL